MPGSIGEEGTSAEKIPPFDWLVENPYYSKLLKTLRHKISKYMFSHFCILEVLKQLGLYLFLDSVGGNLLFSF